MNNREERIEKEDWQIYFLYHIGHLWMGNPLQNTPAL